MLIRAAQHTVYVPLTYHEDTRFVISTLRCAMSHVCVVPGVKRRRSPLCAMNPTKHASIDASRPRATLHSAPRRRRAGRRAAAPRPNPRSRRSFVHTERQLTSHTLCSSTALRGVRGARRGGQLECSRGRQEAPTVPTRSRLNLPRRYRLDLDSISPDGTDSISTQSPSTVPTRSRLDLREMRGFCFQRERAQRRNEHLHARVLLPKAARHSQPASAASAIIACIERCRH